MGALTAAKQKSCNEDSCLFQNLHSRMVAETVQKGCFQSKTKKGNNTNEFYIFELVEVLNFSVI